MKLRNEKITAIILTVIIVLLTLCLVASILLWGVTNDDDITDTVTYDETPTEYIYVDEENYIWDYDPILFSTDANFTKVDETKNWIITSFVNEGKLYTYTEDQDRIYGYPLYEDGLLKGLIYNNHGIAAKIGDDEITLTEKGFDHEVFINNNYTFGINTYNGHDAIYVHDISTNEDYYYDAYNNLGLPDNGSGGNYKWMATQGDELHFNAFDYYEDYLYLNARHFSSIFMIKIADDNVMRNPSDWMFEYVIPSDPTALWFIQEDINGRNPYKFDILNNEVIIDEDYIPTFLNSFKGKVINPIYNGKKYDLENETSALEYEDIDPNDKFFGEHRVSVLNPLLNSNPGMVSNFDEEKIYLSIFDNHWPGADSGSNSFIINHGNYNVLDDSIRGTSYTRIIEVDLVNMSYEIVFTYDNSSLTTTDFYSTICSSSLFFAINNHYYLNVSGENNRNTFLIEFDSIDFDSQELVNSKLVFEIKFVSQDWYNLYRSFIIFKNINNVDYGWNLLEMGKYNKINWI